MIERFEKFHQNIAAAHKYMAKIKAASMDKFGLKAANVMCLYFLGKNEGGLTPMQLCGLCGEDKAGISKSLAVLKQKGYVAFEESSKKYRNTYKITEAGQKVCDEINEIIVDVVGMVGASLLEEERIIFYKSLDAIVGNLKSYYSALD